jgi:uncharacterized SAM-binding protein YcdF (DUF218 family)
MFGQIYSACIVSEPLGQADAILLLAGEYRERAPEAARLFHEGRAPRIVLTNDGVFSSWSQRYQRNLYEVEWATELLVTLGVPRQAIVQLPFIGSGTIYDALAVREYARETGGRSLVIVTSDYHTRRALWTFRQVFCGEPVTIGIVPVASGTDGWFRDRWRMCREVTTEVVKSVYYFVKFEVMRGCRRNT